MKDESQNLVDKVAYAVVDASTMMTYDHRLAYNNAIESERCNLAKWILELNLENAEKAEQRQCALCDDTGIPHLILDIGKGCQFDGHLLDVIRQGVEKGLSLLPGRPMAVMGNDKQRIEQEIGLDPSPSAVAPAPMIIRSTIESNIKLHILMLGGGPEIRGLTKHIFHCHKIEAVEDEIVDWAIEGVRKLGCTPCTLAIGIGRSLFEASALMLEAMLEGKHSEQSSWEERITERVNASGVGALGLGGNNSVLATFIKVGHQRASGVRIVCLRPCCSVEPRVSDIVLWENV